MRAGTASPSETRRRRRGAATLALVALTVVGLSGCYQNPDPREYGAAAKRNFVAGCTTEVTAKNGTTTTVAIENRDTCECIYDKISDTNGTDYIKWEDLKAYEDKQADAKAGELPTPPKHLTAAIKACQKQGPQAQG